MRESSVGILRIDASMRQQDSVSRSLTDRLINHLAGRIADCEIMRRDLRIGVGHTSGAWRDASLTEPEARSGDDRALLAQSDALVSELDRADIIVVAMPIYNFSVPTSFRAWVDLVCRDNVDGRRAKDANARPANKRAVVILTSNYTRFGDEDEFATSYTRFILKFLGAADVQFINATGLGDDREAVINAANAEVDKHALQILSDGVSTAAQ